MENQPFAYAAKAIAAHNSQFAVGRLVSVTGAALIVEGLPAGTRLGARCEIRNPHCRINAEVIKVAEGSVTLLPDAPVEGLAVGEPVYLIEDGTFSPHSGWIGRVIDPDGVPLDGRPILHGDCKRSIHQTPPPAYMRKTLGERISTGYVLFDTLLPIVKGQRIGLFAGSGVGKSTLLAGLARKVEADVIVIALVGERGREVKEFVEEVLGPEGLAKSVVVAATSDRAPQIRKRCALTATAIAEAFRDAGLHVLLLVDSVTRFAEAHREVSAAAGAPASVRGFPSSTAGAIASLCERAGPGVAETGDITAIYSVLVAGSDMEEPVADMLRGVLDGHVVMDRSIAEAGRFPAVDVLRSVSRSLPQAASEKENITIKEVRTLMGAYSRSELMIQSGLYVSGTDGLVDRSIQLKPRFDTAFTKYSGKVSDSFAMIASILSTAQQR